MLWRTQINGLEDLIAPFVADLSLDDSIEQMASRTLCAAPPRFSLIALSMGGYVAFEILRLAPERVERLALIDTSAAPDTRERAIERLAGIESLKLGRFRGVTDRLLPQLIHRSSLDTPVADAVKEMAKRVGDVAFLKQQRAILGRKDSRPLLADIMVPTLVGVGDSDVLTPPRDAEEIHRGVKDSRFHRFTDCGHLPALEKPAETTEILRNWLLA